MKKMICVAIMVIILVFTVIAYCIFVKKMDTKYAIGFSNIFGSYKISEVDNYFDDNTIIIWQGKSGTYRELRHNVEKVFNEKKYKLAVDSSYGNSNDSFVSNIRQVNIEVHVQQDFEGNNNKEMLIEMELKKIGIVDFRIKSIKSEELFFGHLFFGI
ncbi:MAG: hypothetical protein PHI90_09315 [Clostridia bacterium]|nr:hypothetical protein [Clostridia bacterium]